MKTRFVVKFDNGSYYTGRAGDLYQGPRSEAFVYGSIHSAMHRKMLFDNYAKKTVCRVVATLAP